ncbi:MAG: carboxypeptidase-like regulatory domain-containing protein [Cryomorphaceae bacterium]|nr:carboxypeptidase-like regulatory domain-containing protein [Cryomorphaceae bacterium]
MTGVVIAKEDNQPVVGANVIIKGTTTGTTTDVDGKFSITPRIPYPVEVEISFLGLKTKTIKVTQPGKMATVFLENDDAMLGEVTVVEQRLSKQQKESALSVVAIDVKAISETPSVNFYESLGNLQGVDLTSASIGFKIINTRGFNSTSPVRSLQIIDGVDNQAPGLNFSLGNFVGASELDIMSVDIIAGASSAFYGPSAFNGVVSMTTKDPFIFRGTSFSLKVGERNLREMAIRHAKVHKDKKGVDRFAWKINAYYLEANDWIADNYNPTEDSQDGVGNPGGYDAVNIYGDEQAFFNPAVRQYPGLERYYRRGIREVDLVDYDTRNLKLAASFHYRLKNESELIFASNFGYGTTVYQGDNRYSLKDLLFFQNRLEWRKKDKYFIRAYATNEDAGNTYDAYFTALRMQNAVMDDRFWGNVYESHWGQNQTPRVRNMPGFPTANFNNERELWLEQYDLFLLNNQEALQKLHNESRGAADAGGTGDLIPGTPLFDSLFTHYTTLDFADGGTRFFDRSALYHLHGERKFEFEEKRMEIVLGGNGRLYRPNSQGSIFEDTAGIRISNYEYGIYAGINKKMKGELLVFNATIRMDKNQNFGYYFSPAASLIYNIDNVNTVRLSLSSAIRNPTLQDQYLYYNVGRAILLGNLNGRDSLVPTENVTEYLGKTPTERQNHVWEYYDVAPVRPERVQTIEAGYRTTIWNKLFLDMNYYYSFYRDFIGFNIGADIFLDNTIFGDPFTGLQVYRVAANATDRVTTQGFTIGYNYYFWKNFTFNGNYSWNRLNSDRDDPIIPAFNTPEHKYNIGISGSELKIDKLRLKNFGFSINYRWIEGFLFEGSPQFTGNIDSYDMLDAQISFVFEKINCVLKIGGSNVLNNMAFQVYGGPRVGRLLYLSWTYDFKAK